MRLVAGVSGSRLNRLLELLGGSRLGGAYLTAGGATSEPDGHTIGGPPKAARRALAEGTARAGERRAPAATLVV